MVAFPRCLGIDLGNHTGWAVSEGLKITSSGVRDFSIKSHETNGNRGIKFYNFLLSLGHFDKIFYEKVQFTNNFRSGDGGELYKGLLMLVNMYGASFGVEPIGIHPGTLKKAFTGNGRAEKEEMCAIAHSLGWKGGARGTKLMNDEADAIALLVTQVREKYGIKLIF